MSIVRQRAEDEQWGGLMSSLRNVEGASRRIHKTLIELHELHATEPERANALRAAASQVRTANAAVIAAWRTLETVRPVPSERPPHKPAGEM
jgi:hypothetical protein